MYCKPALTTGDDDVYVPVNQTDVWINQKALGFPKAFFEFT